MNGQLATLPPERVNLLPPNADKHTKYRIKKYQDWMTTQGVKWNKPDLAEYRDHLLQDYAPATVSAHLSTVRGQYRRILRDNATREALYNSIADEDLNGADRKAYVDEVITRIQNGIDPKASVVKVKTSQDRPDSDHLRLTKEQAETLINAPLNAADVDRIIQVRDTAIIALVLCTGIREAELSALHVKDLRQSLGGELALHVREGKGCKERLIPYGELDWVLAVVDKWLNAAEITEGPVFRGFYKGNRTMRPGPLSVRAIEYILQAYPIAINGEMTNVKPHDLRRTYARRLYEAGVELVAIQQNLGHASLETTLGYIGKLDVDKRRAPSIYTFDLRKLNGVSKVEA